MNAIKYFVHFIIGCGPFRVIQPSFSTHTYSQCSACNDRTVELNYEDGYKPVNERWLNHQTDDVDDIFPK